MFLFRDGLLTLMNIDSLISLERFCSSLPTTVKLLIVVEWPEMLLWSNIGEGAFRCSLNLSPNVLAVSPIYSWSHSNLSHLYLYIIPLFLVIWSWSLGATSSSFIVLPLLKWTWMPYLLQMFLKVSLSPSLYGTVTKFLCLGLLSCWLLFLFLGLFVLIFILFMAHSGYLQVCNASCISFCSSSSDCLFEQMSLALCNNELITLYLLDMAWWLSHWRYWLVCVGFLYTFVCRLPSLFGVIKVSRKGMDPSALDVSAVNLMLVSNEFM